VRSHHHRHVPPVLLGRRLDEAEVGHVVRQPLQQSKTQLRPRLLPATEHDRHLHLVPGLEEPDDVTLLGLVVVRVDLRPQLHLLDDGLRLVLASFAGLLRVLVLELSVVHELAHRRPGGRGDFDQVEVGLLCQPKGIADSDDADLLTVGSDQADLGNANPVVDAMLDSDGASSGLSNVWCKPGR